jgi:chromosome segregation ATPase
MFKELDDNLKSMNGEISKLQSAVEHIAQSKNVAELAVKTATQLQTSFNTHLTSVTEDVSKILDPHKQLIKATETLTSTISEIDFPSRLDKQEKEINMLKILLFIVCALVLIGTVATILILKK